MDFKGFGVWMIPCSVQQGIGIPRVPVVQAIRNFLQLSL